MPEQSPIVAPRTGRISEGAAESFGLALRGIPAEVAGTRGSLLIDIGEYVDEVTRAFFDQAAQRNRVSPRLSLNLEPTQLLRAGLADTCPPIKRSVYLVRLPAAIRDRALAIVQSQGSADIYDDLSGFLLPGDVMLTPRLFIGDKVTNEWLMVKAAALDTTENSINQESISYKAGSERKALDSPDSDGLAIVDVKLMSQAGASFEDHLSVFRGSTPLWEGATQYATDTGDQNCVRERLRASCQSILDSVSTDASMTYLKRLEYFFVGSGVVNVPVADPLSPQSDRGFLTPPSLTYSDSVLEPVIFSHACASVVFALHRAQARIRGGAVDAVLLAGGLHSSRETVQSMSSLGTLSQHQARPFDEDRDGTHICPGFGALLVMAPATARRLGRKPLGIVRALHIDIENFAAATNSDQVLEHLTKTLGDDAKGPDVVVAHATGTVQGDASEASALAALLEPGIPVVGSKGATGHLLHAAGFTGVAHALAILGQSNISGTRGLHNPLSQLLCMPTEGQSKSLSGPAQRVLVNSVGFGGNLGSFVLTHAD